MVEGEASAQRRVADAHDAAQWSKEGPLMFTMLAFRPGSQKQWAKEGRLMLMLAFRRGSQS